MAEQKRMWRCPSCGKPAFTDSVRRMGQDRSFTGQAIAPRCRFCHAQARPRMTTAGWIAEGCLLALAALSVIAWGVVNWGLGVDLSAWSVPWLLGSVGIALLVIPARRPFMRLGRSGMFKDRVYPANWKREGNKDPAFNACGVLAGKTGETDICVSVVKRKGRTVLFRVVAPEELRDNLKTGTVIRASETPGSLYRLTISGEGSMVEADR